MYLLDTHVLLWALTEDVKLSNHFKKIIVDPQNDIWVSAASIWEIYLKQSLGKLELASEVEGFIQELGFRELSITYRHAKAAALLPKHHADPFDRMLIAQAKLEKLKILTMDRQFSLYE